LVVVATVVSLAASLGADRLAVLVGTSLFPSTTGYTHFRFSDYSELTIIGVVAAGAAWPVVTRISSQARWLFFRLAIVVSAVLLLPDVWLLIESQPTRAVAVLVVMHLAIALVTYNLLVHVAPVGTGSAVPAEVATPEGDTASKPAASVSSDGPTRAVWFAMSALVGVEAILGVAALVVVPVGRPDAWVPASGRDIYLAHAVVGGVLGIGAVVLFMTQARADRLSRNSAVVGLFAVGVGAAGGVLAVYHPERIVGMGLMLLGALVAGSAYLAPIGLAERELGPARSPSVAARGANEWRGDQGAELACATCHVSAEEARTRLAAGMDSEEWAAGRIAAGTCPLCPDRRLRIFGGVLICECCETVYRRLPGNDDDVMWAATPGERVTRS
jgi:hypothetical protein